MTNFRSHIILVALTGSALVACEQTPIVSPSLVGTWKSTPVTLDRGDFKETYLFTLSIEDGRKSLMEITYDQTDEPNSERLIRQDMEVMTSEEAITFHGSNPRLVSGPEIVGVYEPDMLSCAPLAVAAPDALTCGWGSPAHGDGPQVDLMRESY